MIFEVLVVSLMSVMVISFIFIQKQVSELMGKIEDLIEIRNQKQPSYQQTTKTNSNNYENIPYKFDPDLQHEEVPIASGFMNISSDNNIDTFNMRIGIDNNNKIRTP